MITLDYTNVMNAAVGAHGLSDKELNESAARAGMLCSRLVEERREGKLKFADLPREREVARRVARFAAERRSEFRNVVHIGIGGSALGPLALHSALKPRLYNLHSVRDRDFSPRLFFLDNIDPEETRELLEFADPKETLYHVVTKSGDTTETAAGFMAALERVKRAVGDKFRRHFVVTTGPKGALRQWAEREKISAFEIPDGVGGRFSVLTPVGLLPAALFDVNPEDLLAGAEQIESVCFRTEPKENPAFMLALMSVLLDTQRGKNIHVLMPYVRALRDVADWFRQLWAESLGKKIEVEGKLMNVGPTPVLALGATDQHSQIQLYVEGPNNKFVLFMTAQRPRHEEILPDGGEEAYAFLRGKKLSELIGAMQRGTEIALAEAGRPSARLELPDVSPKTVGALIYLLEVATVFAGYLYGVNPFDQPGVEAGKRAAFALLGRAGYEAERARLETRLGAKRYTVS